MRTATNTLLKGWPETTLITGKKRQFLGYRIRCRYNTPWGRRRLGGLSAAMWLGAFVAALGITGDLPENEAGSAMMTWLLVLGGTGQFLLLRMLQSTLELEIRPQAIRWKKGGWKEFETGSCEFAIYRDDRAQIEEAKEQRQYYEIRQGKNNVEMPGRWFRNSASVALIVMGQRVDIAHVYDKKGGAQGPRKALDLYTRLEACLQDVRARDWGRMG